MERRRQIRDRVPEARVTLAELRVAPRPTQVDVARLLVDRVVERLRQRARPRAVDALAGHPEQLALGEHHEHPIRATVLPASTRPPSPPTETRRGRRREQNEVLRLVERLRDRAPQVRIGRQARVVTEHAQRAQPVPRLSEPLQPSLQRRLQLPVSRTAVRDECVVCAAAPVRLWLFCRRLTRDVGTARGARQLRAPEATASGFSRRGRGAPSRPGLATCSLHAPASALNLRSLRGPGSEGERPGFARALVVRSVRSGSSTRLGRSAIGAVRNCRTSSTSALRPACRTRVSGGKRARRHRRR